ncbi:MAG: hypothetical protein F9K40_16580 [Kofleriaceae bacterium]|nr:MAG: hypothetical protein F9K40_16580 [Kofleriaceae bacterium]MBZ0233020.1 HPF/RaiA family ribosome-associated protein [Kofleriaceae bacterium]
MHSFIEVTFHQLDPDRSVENAVHRWVARLAGTQLEIRHVRVRLERIGRRRTGACLELTLQSGQPVIATTAHEDAFVAIADAFRAARHQVLASRRPAAPRFLTAAASSAARESAQAGHRPAQAA